MQKTTVFDISLQPPVWNARISRRFPELMALAQERDGEVCIGYKSKSRENDAAKSFGVKLIPLKDSQVTSTVEDSLVLVAEDDL